jgi:hypothetical protein
MKISRQHLIDICDNFLKGKIDNKVFEHFASNLITSDENDWESDEIISETLFEWDNKEISYPINKGNMQLWKNRLSGGVDELAEYNIWNHHIDKQKEICHMYNSKWTPINKKLKVGISANLNLNPLNALRYQKEQGTTGWFIWTGDYSEADDFFKPMCAEHLLQIRPQTITYLGLGPGFRFIIDKNGYEDVWYDEKLKIE